MASIREHPRRDGTVSYYVLWRDPDTGRQTSMSFPVRQEAENFRRILEGVGGHEGQALHTIDAIRRKVPTVAQVVEDYIGGQPSITERTRADYRRDARRYIVPHLGGRPADTLTGQMVRDWLKVLSGTQRSGNNHPGVISDKTIANVHGLLSAAMNEAVENETMKSNPSRGVRLPRRTDHEAVEMVCLTHEDWALIDAALGETLGGHHRLLFRTLVGTGMRWGEAAALRVQDLTLTGRQPSLRVARAQKRDENSRNYIGPTKTPNSRRTIPLPPPLVPQLKAHVAGRPSDDRVFKSRMGNALNHSNVRSMCWLPALAKARLNGLTVTPRIHDLRHTYASWHIAAGTDIFTTSRLLGHESTETTTKRYSHVMPSQYTAAANAIASVFEEGTV
jgi:integrase